MNVTVRYFAAAAEAVGLEEAQIVVEPDATFASLKAVLADRYGDQIRRVMVADSFLIDQVVRRDPAAALCDRVDVLPPFAGG